MIETIRLFREKKHDILALYILEFFKFIGCFVCDCELRETIVLALNLDDKYDVNLFLADSLNDAMMKEKYQEYKQQLEGCIVFLPILPILNSRDLLHSKSGGEMGSEKLLREIVEKIWENEKAKTELLFLCKVYCENNLFFYLYNEGNRKFIQEQHYSLRIRQRLESALRETAQLSFKYFKKGYSRLYQRAENESEELLFGSSPYYSYAEIVLMYKLNQKMMNMEDGNIFKIESLMERARGVMEKVPDFIRINYLAGSICRDKEGYYREAEYYFIKTIEMLKNKNVNGLRAFVYYRLGNLEGNVFGHQESAQRCYRDACNCNGEYYPAMLKLAEISNREEGIELCNKVIRILLNGYSMEKVMPKQQIYAYEAFKILGDIFKSYDDYDIATRCYQNAKKLAGTKSEFYNFFDEKEFPGNEGELSGFYEIVQRSMPTEPILYRLLECAEHEGNREQIEKYFEEM